MPVPAIGAAVLPAVETAALAAAVAPAVIAPAVMGAGTAATTGAASASSWLAPGVTAPGAGVTVPPAGAGAGGGGGGGGALGQAMGGAQPPAALDAITQLPPNAGNMWNQARNMKPEDIAKLAEEPGFWSKFGDKAKDFAKGAKKGAGGAAANLSRLPAPQMGSTGHSFSPVGSPPGMLSGRGGLSAIARAIMGRR